MTNEERRVAFLRAVIMRYGGPGSKDPMVVLAEIMLRRMGY